MIPYLTSHLAPAAPSGFFERLVEAGTICGAHGLCDRSILTTEALASQGLVRLPQSLQEALDRFDANDTVKSWFPQGFADV